MALFFTRAVTPKKNALVELVLSLIGALLLGFGTLFLFLWAEIYITLVIEDGEQRRRVCGRDDDDGDEGEEGGRQPRNCRTWSFNLTWTWWNECCCWRVKNTVCFFRGCLKLPLCVYMRGSERVGGANG
uniref:Dolichyl-diphosphooligosaccharide-protein glycosyltransferase subunit OST5 n=1 Tax=Hyaloperonospora arabidopsidis (strain Emoy2) TaxID=559515 RepID=M4B8N0_HYAAE